MGKRGIYYVCMGLAVVSSVLGCAATPDSEDGVSVASQAVVGVDEYLYLRCNSTGWGVDSSTQLIAGGQAGVYSIEYNVSAPYMITNGDQCVVTRSNSANGWGSVSASFGASNTSVVSAPGQWSLGAINSTPATIRYPALGRYRASVNWANSTVAITAVDTSPPIKSNYYYLRCNATGWNVGTANRLTAGQSGLTLTYAVKDSWMVTGGDQCVVTRTDQLDGWGTSQVAFGTAQATTLVVPSNGSASTTVASGGTQFAVRYPALGQYRADFDPTTGKLSILVPGSDVPATGLHGAVQSLGGSRVRVTYDFQSSDQLQDFVSTNAATTSVSLVNGQLLVQNTASTNTINAATLVKGFNVDSIQYQAQLESGDHVNVYVGTLWDGTWNPARGYGAIHRNDGQVFVANGTSQTLPGSTAVVPGTLYSGRISATEQGLTWTLNASSQSLAFPYYGGTTRTVALGGYASTVLFDNIVLEGTVAGFESDGTETNPGTIHGKLVNLADGRVRISYDFADVQQKFDFAVNSATSTRRELNDGRLIVSHAGSGSDLKVALFRHHLRVDSVSYRAELLSGDHVNVYLNTIWDGNWAPAVGCVGIHRYDGRLFAINGAAVATGDATAVARRTPYIGEVLLNATGLNWTVNGASVALNSPCYAGTDGTVGLGSYASDVSFDDVVIEGQLQ